MGTSLAMTGGRCCVGVVFLFFFFSYNTEGVLYCYCLMPSTISGRIITGSRLWRVELSMIAIHHGCGDTRLGG